MMKNVSVTTDKDVLLDINAGTAGKDTIKATVQGESVVCLSGAEKQYVLNPVLHLPDVETSLQSVLSLCNDHHTV